MKSTSGVHVQHRLGDTGVAPYYRMTMYTVNIRYEGFVIVWHCCDEVMIVFVLDMLLPIEVLCVQ